MAPGKIIPIRSTFKSAGTYLLLKNIIKCVSIQKDQNSRQIQIYIKIPSKLKTVYKKIHRITLGVCCPIKNSKINAYLKLCFGLPNCKIPIFFSLIKKEKGPNTLCAKLQV